MAKLCLCLTGKTIEKNLEILNKYRKFADVAELRVDCLDQDERLHIRRFPQHAGLPVILTVRRDIDGGFYAAGEGARIKLLALGLSFANANSRLNFAYVDIEEDLDVPSLEEAARTFGTRIIRSYHNMNGIIDDIPGKILSMKRTGDEIIKVGLKVNSTSDVLKVFHASKACADQEKIIVCIGHYGIYTRILAEKFGSFLTYSSALSEDVVPASIGQLDVQELAELYRFRRITEKTNVFGITGYPLKSSASPWFFNTIFALENTDAVYVPFPSSSINDIVNLAVEMDIKGLSVTAPYKEEVLFSGLAKCSPAVVSIGACNTISRRQDGWYADNTDYTGLSDSLLAFLGRKNLKRQKITIIGAGGVARAAASEIFRLGGKALILNRTLLKAKNIASEYNFRWGGLDSNGIELMSKYSDVIIQTTSAGMEGYNDADPLEELYNFTGNEYVMDVVYIPEQTPFLKRAAEAGCKTLNGYDMLIRQACVQYNIFMGKDVPHQFFSRINAGEDTWKKIQKD